MKRVLKAVEQELNRIDLEKAVAVHGTAGHQASKVVDPVLEERKMPRLYDFLQELQLRKLAGHELMCADDPLRRLIGFVDYRTSEYVVMTLRVIKAREGMDSAEGKTLMKKLGLTDLSDLARQEIRSSLMRNPRNQEIDLI